MWGSMFSGIKDIHGALGLSYNSFIDPYGYIVSLYSLVFFKFTMKSQGRIKEKIAGIYLGKKGQAELTLGGYNPQHVNTIKYYTAYNYNGMWEISVINVAYKGYTSNIYERRGLIMLNVPYIIISVRDFQPIWDRLQSETKNKCYRDSNTYAFWCEVTSRDINQFGSLDFSLGPGNAYSVGAEKLVDIVFFLSSIWKG